jgi:hypothetical protein
MREAAANSGKATIATVELAMAFVMVLAVAAVLHAVQAGLQPSISLRCGQSSRMWCNAPQHQIVVAVSSTRVC